VAYKDLARLMQVNETQAHFASCTQAAVACSCLPCQIPAATQQLRPKIYRLSATVILSVRMVGI